MKLDSDQNQTLLTFISENWEQFVGHVAGHNGVTEEEAEELADAISEALEEAVMYD
ncbi:hypothetical protein Ahp2_04 [Aeromonas phage Ahp2]|nr:hypothetical protein Ahp2_04 [Aeromonas phage Ahp2]